MGLSIWIPGKGTSAPRFFTYQECRTVAGLIVTGVAPTLAAHLVARGRFETSSHAFERYADTIEGSCLELLAAVIQTADGQVWDLLGDPSDLVPDAEYEWDIDEEYQICASRGGVLASDELALRLSQLITVRPDLKASARQTYALEEPEKRYLGHVEDEPMIFQFRTDDLEDACSRVRDAVEQRLNRNGCGDGLVFDRYGRRIVAIYGALPGGDVSDAPRSMVGRQPFPDKDEQDLMVSLVRAWDNQGPHDPSPEFIWHTYSG